MVPKHPLGGLGDAPVSDRGRIMSKLERELALFAPRFASLSTPPQQW